MATRGRPRRAPDKVNTADLFAELSNKLKRQAREPNVLGYIPLAKQTVFHKSDAHIRLYIGGNRSGKTTSGVVEDIYFLRGEHPYKKVPEAPIQGRIVTTSFNEGVKEVIIPKLKQWIPPSLLINGSWEDSYSKGERVLTLANGSTCELMSYDQDQQKFSGTSRHFTHFDEEPPFDIYTECMARLIDTQGDAWLTLTPLDGMTWIYDDLYIPGREGRPHILVVEASIYENTNLSDDAIARYLETVNDPDERQARISGKFIQLGGKVYKEYDPGTEDEPGIHIIENFDYKKCLDWEWHVSMDHGLNNPTCFLWHVISPQGEIITFDEHYANEMTVAEHAAIVLEKCRAYGKMPTFVGDPSIAQRSAITMTSIQQEYSSHGVYIGLGNNDVNIGINKVKGYMRINPKTKRPTWRHTPNCVNLKRELLRLRWKTYQSKKMQHDHNPYEEIHKRDDHAPDALRYEFSWMPDLAPVAEVPNQLQLPPQTAVRRYDEVLAEMTYANNGWNVVRPQTVWNDSGYEISGLEGD